MRIIAGLKRGMRLLSPKTDSSRPYTDRVKESLFNVLMKYNLPLDAIVADLFCGIGSLGLESLSRGAKFVCFVENDTTTAAILKKNIEKIGFVEQAKIVRASAFTVGAPVEPDGQKYNLVFVDPPYALSRDTAGDSALGKLLYLLQEQTVADAIVIVRTARPIETFDRYGKMTVIDRRQWGSMSISILRHLQE